jgi:hypothetical protein
VADREHRITVSILEQNREKITPPSARRNICSQRSQRGGVAWPRI